jgi:hypothetical protein
MYPSCGVNVSRSLTDRHLPVSTKAMSQVRWKVWLAMLTWGTAVTPKN